MNVERPIPRLDADSRPYFAAAAQGEFKTQQCSACGVVRFPPRLLCTECWSDKSGWVELSGKGEVYAFTVVHRAATPAFADAVPYVVALIELDEDVRVVANILDCEPGDVSIGSKVTVQFEKLTDEIGLPQFSLEEVAA